MSSLFDLRALFVVLDASRKRRQLSWSALSRQIGVAASTLRRFAEADDAEADGVLAVLRWLRAIPEEFIGGDAVNGEMLPDDGRGYIRVDMELVAEASGNSPRAGSRRRTTIQRLVAVAQESGSTVRSLTRFSEM